MSKNKLYVVEFGDPDEERDFFSSSVNLKPLFVVASDYVDAGRKAEAWLRNKKSEMVKNITTEDGLKDTSKIDKIGIVTVKITADEHLIM